MLGRLSGATIAAALVAGCSFNHEAPLTTEARMCQFVEHRLAVGIPGEPVPKQDGLSSSLAAEIEASLAAHDALDKELNAPPATMLFLSGGSEHGAYGAGILENWGGDGDIPEMQIVTGISTGSILSSFAFVGKGDFAAEGYTLKSEKQLLKVFSKPVDGKPGFANYKDLVTKGAFADLDPLRGELVKYLTRPYARDGAMTDVLHEVARRHGEGARLYVGVVDIDTGQGVAFDMGEMAARYVAAADSGAQAQRQRWRDCYVDAIVASSSTPMAALPAFIDNTLYVDGGARFGLFGEAFREVFDARRQLAEKDGEAPRPPRVYAVVNGTLDLPAPKCPKKDGADCHGDPVQWSAKGQHKDWNIAQLALASQRVLANQVYRFSAMAVEGEACEQAGCFNFLRIEPDVADFAIELPSPLNAGQEGPQTCYRWKEIDIAVDNPIQFHRRYMRCLIRYGAAKVVEKGWGASE